MTPDAAPEGVTGERSDHDRADATHVISILRNAKIRCPPRQPELYGGETVTLQVTERNDRFYHDGDPLDIGDTWVVNKRTGDVLGRICGIETVKSAPPSETVCVDTL